ncbi:ATP-dependent_RNA helicase [Hexamita inflata]|uniref:ATP-dependent RNA helicase n=1 Tax=Hexamita inflata TaxID=28002 RepID=A0AA86U0S9_9EUKA|nr:ATP-dependent RNA helicase [Hexamita inflata]
MNMNQLIQNFKQSVKTCANPFIPDIPNLYIVSDTDTSHRTQVKFSFTQLPENALTLDSAPNLPEFLVRALLRLNYDQFTPIQLLSFSAFKLNKDLVAVSPTGSGKTVAFCAPIIAKIYQQQQQATPSVQKQKITPSAVITAPTRELCLQILQVLFQLTYQSIIQVRTFVGGHDANLQRQILGNACDILVCTPSALLELKSAKEIDLSNITDLIVDEADQIQSNFQEFVQLTKCHKCLYTATCTSAQARIFGSILTDPVFLKIKAELNIQFVTLKVPNELKYDTLKYILSNKGQFLVFTSSKISATRLFQQLQNEIKTKSLNQFNPECKKFVHTFLQMDYEINNSIDIISSDASVTQRNNTIDKFKLKQIKILIATDLLQRGIDFTVDYVINYQETKDAKEFEHRAGRTGRAGRNGMVITFQ